VSFFWDTVYYNDTIITCMLPQHHVFTYTFKSSTFAVSQLTITVDYNQQTTAFSGTCTLLCLHGHMALATASWSILITIIQLPVFFFVHLLWICAMCILYEHTSPLTTSRIYLGEPGWRVLVKFQLPQTAACQFLHYCSYAARTPDHSTYPVYYRLHLYLPNSTSQL